MESFDFRHSCLCPSFSLRLCSSMLSRGSRCFGKKRGSYGGVIAKLSNDGSFDSCIAIRSAFVKDDTAYVQAGCGVVYDSVPMDEANETRKKAAAVLNAIAISHGSTLKEIQ